MDRPSIPASFLGCLSLKLICCSSHCRLHSACFFGIFILALYSLSIFPFGACYNHMTKHKQTHRYVDIALLFAVLLLSALFILESDDCYFAYWQYDTFWDFLRTQPDTQHALIVSVPQNGRYLGNLLGVVLAKAYDSPLFPIRILYFGGGILLLAAGSGLSFGAQLRRREALFFTLALLILAHRGIWQEVYGWGAAYVNYLTPMIGLVFLPHFIKNEGRAYARLRLLFLASLSFVCCLFMETVTIFLVLAATLGLLGFLGIRRQLVPNYVALWLGSALGAAVMFSCPGYHAVGSDGLREMGVDFICHNLSTILVSTLIRPTLVALLITGLLLWHLRQQNCPFWRVLAALALPIHAICIWEGVRDLFEVGQPAPWLVWVAVVLAALWVVMLLLWRGGSAKLQVLGLVAALCLFSGPLLVIFIGGNRIFFSSYVVLTLVALTLYAAARAQGMTLLLWPRALALILSLALIFIYSCNCVVYRQRLAFGREAATTQVDYVTLPILPFPGFARNEQQWKGDISYQVYRETPWDLDFYFIPYRQWAQQQDAAPK